jgi:hypothetical protein
MRLVKECRSITTNNAEIITPASIQYLMNVSLLLNLSRDKVPIKADNINAKKFTITIARKEKSEIFDADAVSRKNINAQRYQTRAFATNIAFVAALLGSKPSILVTPRFGIAIA